MVILQQFNVHVYLNLNWTFRAVLVFIWFDLYKSLLKWLKSGKNTSTNRVGNPKQVLVPKTLKATIVLRMTEIDQVIIRGIQESSLLEKEVNMLVLLS